MDSNVKITSVKHIVGFDPATLLPAKRVQVTYNVGPHGPFNLVTPEENFTPDYVDQHTQKTVNTLRTIGALHAGT